MKTRKDLLCMIALVAFSAFMVSCSSDDEYSEEITESNVKVRNFTVGVEDFKMIKVEKGSFKYNEQEYMISKDFYIGQTEVTQGLWIAVMGDIPKQYKYGSKKPVDQVSYDQVLDFILKLNKLTGAKFRLPTVNEWRFAAIGGNLSETGEPKWGQQYVNIRFWNGKECNQTKYNNVGELLPNELGLYDMIGNVAEMCIDDSVMKNYRILGYSRESCVPIDDPLDDWYDNCIGFRLAI